MSDAVTPDSNCRNCGTLFNRAGTADGSYALPENGDWTLCIRCGTLHVYNADLTLRDPTAAEQYEADADPDLQEMKARITHINSLH